ncbi:Acetoacetyl-CoA synthetase-like protein [Emericellopsis cladophorae]|uniref:Acetoacetyl-CoA synthetase-like protein n=1 Tax=Emericellopsis cladophorae TaxID=2686198 RepID=A0A9Q0BH77_9HYPO|nr:Acetoacetyl-CoA synthetase-like protein [Emericellopsis cladophorae]KAI6784776.1 Acetoacetyl-CoA synthetase-like protein [Emericellopsis cladophorae]
MTQSNGSGQAEVLWRHPDPTSTPMWRFLQNVKAKHELDGDDYQSLYKWSVDDVATFWEECWGFVGIVSEKGHGKALSPGAPMFPRPDFFSGSRLNFAQNLLYPPTSPELDPESAAVLTVTELPGSGVRETTWAALRDAVRRCSSALRARGLQPGDVVAGYVSNHVEALVAMLGAATVGAIWTGISPDNGVSAVLDRLGQISPKFLFADNGTVYNGKEWSSTAKTTEIMRELRKSQSLTTVVIIPNITADLCLQDLVDLGVQAVEYHDFLATAPEEALRFVLLPPSHPLYILYSSGTTGLPKAIVHTALGTLLQHKKEHMLHCGLTPASRMLYYTTTSWMMWHWSIGALAVGTTLVLYSGSPFRPNGYLSLPKVLSDLKVTHFGTSAAYLTALEANNVYPARDENLDLSCLEAIYSTASPLPPSTFKFVYEAFPKHVNLASITGGTDIISLFGAPCPLLPVRVGEIQCAGLGMAIRVIDPLTAQEVPQGEPGDLICVRPFPCQPLTFFGENGQEKYKSAYFERFANVCGVKGDVWHHGDFVKMLDVSTGSLTMLGRSDGVLKPSGVRFGSAEIYNILTRYFAAEIEDAVCVGRRRENDNDETVCLFVVMAPGKKFDDMLQTAVKAKIKAELSPRHVPGIIEECGGGVPKTGNGKKIEVAVKQILSGMAVKTNASVANPEALEWFKAWTRTH